MTRLLLVGYGRMGKLVESLAGEYGCEIAGVVDPVVGKDGVDSDRWSKIDVEETRAHRGIAGVPLDRLAAERDTTPFDLMLDLALADDMVTRFRVVMDAEGLRPSTSLQRGLNRWRVSIAIRM